MILIDARVGSNHLLTYLPKWVAEYSILDFGDCCFTGKGPENKELKIGIEVKKLADLLASLTSGRLVGYQLPGLLGTYDRVYLIVEGWYSASDNGELVIINSDGAMRRTWTHKAWRYSDLDGWLNTIANKARVAIKRTIDTIETAAAIYSLYLWWQKDWNEHRGLDQFYDETPITLERPSIMRRIAALLPGIGWEKSAKIEEAFGTIYKMITAKPEEWEKIPGIGKKITAAIQKTINGE